MSKELPVYVSHKKVRALEIRSVGSAHSLDANGKLRREVHFADPDFPSIWVSGDMFVRYVPIGGDYYVVYEDGYTSFSPRKVFLEGYSLANDGNVLMERLSNLADPLQPLPAWLATDNWADQISRLAREAYVTIFSLKHQIERLQADVTATRQMAGFKEVKTHEKADPDQSA